MRFLLERGNIKTYYFSIKKQLKRKIIKLETFKKYYIQLSRIKLELI